MELDRDTCYAALLARDRRFDGRFFTGVRTTGIYCRPVCPARTPKRENVTFYSHAAAAEAAGFRPCKRCRPERAPGSASWAEVPEVVSRALDLIGAGALDSAGVDDLADRLAIGSRQLRRLFDQHVGAGPLAVAKARRVHFARRLLDETALPAAHIAFAAGFNSVRQFNHDVRATFGKPPGELRNARAASNGTLRLRLSYRPPFDWDAIVRFLAARATRGVEAVEPGRYARTIPGGWIEVRPGPDALKLALHVETHDNVIGLVERARRLFDLGADPAAIGAHLSADPALAPLVAAHPGMRVPGAWDPFETAVRTVLGQQISVRAATTLAGRLVEAFGKPLDASDDPALTHRFPAADVLADAAVESVGTTKGVARAIRGLGAGVADGSIVLAAPRGLDDLVARLCALPGIGPWTAHVIAMKACGEPDAFPAGDLGVRAALGGVTEREAAARAEAWRPWRAYAAMHLWIGGTT